MLERALVMAGLAAAVTAVLHVEWRRHGRSLASIEIRIHVNGTRGKSSVSRLIAAILREAGIRTVAKTTGTTPRLIFPDGEEEPVCRNGPPNIGELTRVMKRAGELGARAIVFECMAVDPRYQRIAEGRIVQPTLTVITNARLDHTDVQGASRVEVAAGFPVRPGGTLVTADPLVAQVLGPGVTDADGIVHVAPPFEGDLALRYLEHPENAGLALKVAELLGIPRDVAVRGMRRCTPDPGRALVVQVGSGPSGWRLVNLFAANDPESTFHALDTVGSPFTTATRPIVLFVCRADRAARSAEFAGELAARQDEFSAVVVWGDRTRAMSRLARARGLRSERLVDAGSMGPAALTRLLESSMNGHRVVVGMGNIVGPAQEWLEHLAPQVKETVA